jgi:uncharacterized membrane protein
MKMLSESHNLTEEKTLDWILKLQAEGLLRLQNQTPQSLNLANYLKTDDAVWYWLTILLEVTTVILFLGLSESANPWFFARNVLGLIFILFLPGFTFTKAILPISKSSDMASRSLEAIEQIALSIGISIAVVSIVGLLLYHSPLGLNYGIVVLCLLAITFVLATAAVFREYQVTRNRSDTTYYG